MRCYCNLSLKEMVDRDGLALQRAGSITEPSSEARVLGVDAASKSPGWLDTGTLLPSPALRQSPRYEVEELELGTA